MKVLEDWVSGEDPFPGLQMGLFSLYIQIEERQRKREREKERVEETEHREFLGQ